MSARPRPVTATFIPHDLQPPVLAPTRYSFSSSGSTDSLISVLNHDSYQSCSDSENELQEHVKDTKMNETKAVRPGSGQMRRKTASVPERNHCKNERNKHSEPSTNTVTQAESKCSTWEDWVVRKAKEERVKVNKEMRKKRAVEREANMKAEEEKAQKAKGEEKVKEWLDKLEVREKTRKAMEEQNKRTKEELEEEKKREIQEKADKKYKEWMAEKKQKIKELKRAEKEKKMKEEEEKQKKLEKSKEAFDQWANKAANRPRSAQNSFGYTCGKLTGYHDTAAYPVPGFYNPIPWHPIAIPKEKTVKKSKQPAKYKWNPNKYL